VTIHGIVAGILLGLAVAVVLASSVGILVMRDAYQKLHYVTPIAVVAPVIVAVAVLIQSGWTENSAETWLAVLFMLIGGPFLTHATIRAARIRDQGDWRPRKHRGGAARQAAAARPGSAGQDPAGGRDG
jgi:multisubunit Na+/H+ antiporter MnhG subunit